MPSIVVIAIVINRATGARLAADIVRVERDVVRARFSRAWSVAASLEWLAGRHAVESLRRWKIASQSGLSCRCCAHSPVSNLENCASYRYQI